MSKKIIYIDNFLTEHGYTPTIGNTITALLEAEGYTIVKTSSKKNKFLRLLNMLNTIIQHNNAAVVCITVYSGLAFYFALLNALLCRALGIQYFACLHGGNLPQRIKKTEWFARILLNNASKIITVSDYLKEAVKQYKAPIHVIANPININNYPFQQRSKTTIKLLWVRSFHTIYNPLMAVKVVSLLLQKKYDVSLTMVGPDKDGTFSIIKKHINDRNLQQHIHLAGFKTQQEWAALAKEHDLFINTSRFDNLPVSVIEAMALGLPIITTKVGGLSYLIEEGKEGCLVADDDATAMANKIEALYNNPQQYAAMNIQARKKAELFDWAVVKQQWHKVLQ